MFAATLNNVFDDEVIGARGQITGYGLDPDDFFGTGKKTSSAQKGDKSGSSSKDDFNPLGFPEDKLSPLGP